MIIKILGTGCPNCKRLEANVQQAVAESKVEAVIEKVTDMGQIIEYGVMSTPALVIDEKIVSYGVIPGISEIKEMLSKKEVQQSEVSAKKSSCGCSCGGKC